MSQSDQLRLTCHRDNEEQTYTIRFECGAQELVGKTAKLEFISTATTKHPAGLSERKTVFEREFIVGRSVSEIKLDCSDIAAINYLGKSITISSLCRVKVDDGILFDSSVSTALDSETYYPPSRDINFELGNFESGSAIRLKDKLSLWRNFGALSLGRKLQFLLLWLVFGLVALLNLGVSMFDQFYGAAPLLYQNLGDTPPVMFGIGGMFGGFIGLKLTMKRVLRSYMSVRLKDEQRKLNQQDRPRVSDFFSAVSSVSLRNVRVRIVAQNCEKGAYEQDDKDGNSETRTISTPILGAVLFDKSVAQIRRGLDIANYFSDEVSFEKMFEHFIAGTHIGHYHKLDLAIKLQICVPDLADHELEIPSSYFERSSFAKH